MREQQEGRNLGLAWTSRHATSHLQYGAPPPLPGRRTVGGGVGEVGLGPRKL